jgi:hypothetical protein
MYKFVYCFWLAIMFNCKFVLFLLLGKKKLKCFRHKESIAANSGWRLNEDKQIDVRKLKTIRSLYLRFYYCVIKF